MEKSRLVTWLEIGTGISVFVGLLLVTMELRQSNDHASAQSILEFYNDWTEIYQYESQYQIDLLIGKAIEQPDQLTDSELYRLDDYYSLVISSFMVRELMEELGLNPVRRVSVQARSIVEEFFYYPVSRAWSASNSAWVAGEAPVLDRAIQDALSETPAGESSVWVDAWRREFVSDE